MRISATALIPMRGYETAGSENMINVFDNHRDILKAPAAEFYAIYRNLPFAREL